MNRIREPAVAGTFYPNDAQELKSVIANLLENAERSNVVAELPKAIVAPHAGYVYSGPIAASAYAALKNGREKISRVVLLGPAHRVRLRGLALPETDAFATPLGAVSIEPKAVQSLAVLPQVCVLDEAHAFEHSLEVQLPFLQTVLEAFQLVPLVVGDAGAERVAEVLERLWGGPETLIVVSSDLSHYHDYVTAERMDRGTSRAIELLAYDELQHDQACGLAPLRGLLLEAQKRAMTARTVDLRNSGDTAGPRDQVVGYGAYVFHGAERPAG